MKVAVVSIETNLMRPAGGNEAMPTEMPPEEDAERRRGQAERVREVAEVQLQAAEQGREAAAARQAAEAMAQRDAEEQRDLAERLRRSVTSRARAGAGGGREIAAVRRR